MIVELIRLREEQGVSQQELAMSIAKPVSYIQDVEDI